jgi:cytochrome c oxidase cbb3-type subunit 3
MSIQNNRERGKSIKALKSPGYALLTRLIVLHLLILTSIPVLAAESTTLGARLYSEQCAACHGADGHGGVGVPLALPSFLSSVDDDYLRGTIRLGRPGRVMPGFSKLSNSEIDAIVSHLRSWPHKPSSAKFPHTRIRGNASLGKPLFEKYCAACHGVHGEGGHGTGVTMSRPRNAPILAPALNNPGFLAASSDYLIKSTLMHGRAGTPMTSFLQQGLNERDINDIVAYVRSFEASSPHPSATLLESESPILVQESTYTLEQTVEKVKVAVGAANLRLIRVQNLDQGFAPKGKENPNQVIVYSCDFGFLNEALKVDPRVGLFLPCRITVTKHGDKVRVMAVNPKRLSRIFNNAELNALCDQMYQVYVGILEEAVL